MCACKQQTSVTLTSVESVSFLFMNFVPMEQSPVDSIYRYNKFNNTGVVFTNVS